jgi:hypothetical protein
MAAGTCGRMIASGRSSGVAPGKGVTPDSMLGRICLNVPLVCPSRSMGKKVCRLSAMARSKLASLSGRRTSVSLNKMSKTMALGCCFSMPATNSPNTRLGQGLRP